MTQAMINQYHEVKAKHPDALLMFRCGDFYEMYSDDAETASGTLGITVTDEGDGTRLAVFPSRSIDTYLPRLVRAGHRIAICDQLEAPKATVRRGITETFTPNTAEP